VTIADDIMHDMTADDAMMLQESSGLCASCEGPLVIEPIMETKYLGNVTVCAVLIESPRPRTYAC